MPFTTNILGAGLFLLASTVTALTTGNSHQNSRRSYTLQDNYDSTNLFNSFDFYTGSEPTHGYVNYQSQSSAASMGLTSTQNNQVYMGVDHRTVNPQPGRASVRVASKKSYTHGLFIADIAHMPGSACGVWPAYWLLGTNWPNNGEIDILEGINLGTTNSITLHTKAGCTINTANSQPDTTLLHTDCNQDSGNVGCGISSTSTNMYGEGFNAIGGGIYVTQWTSAGIYVWFFPRNKIPADITRGAPIPGIASWGTPAVSFNGGGQCNIDNFFGNHQIVFDTTFCGDWAGNPYVWAASECSKKGNLCSDYVGQNPYAFASSYWLINSVKVYQ